jgi:ribonuclease HI
MQKRIQIVTDGSAIGNPGPGGWAAVFLCDKRRGQICGSEAITTAPEMELIAAIEALRTLIPGSAATLRSDSEYLIREMRHLAVRWQNQGWRNGRGSPLTHSPLWKELLRLNDTHQVHWQWVRGHNGHPMQTQADRLAYSRARELWCELRQAA